MATSSSSQKQTQEFNAFSVIEAAGERRKVCESSKLFDVFINHRGPDVKGTLATQLYNSLQQLGIETFLDSEEKELGNSFPSIIDTAIRSAKVHIAIFSKRYAESAWCLNELVLMLESTAKIIPVFYQVKPSDLRHIETGVYAGAFISYKEKGRCLDKLEGWKEALRSLSLIAGEEFNNDWDFRKLVMAVQKEVQRKTCLHVAEYPVGLNNLVEDFEKRCLEDLVQDFENQCGQEEGKQKAQVVGIFGMGGVGKTTLAKELFNCKGFNYRRASFLFDVLEKSVTSQLPSLQCKLIKDLFGTEISFTSTEEGTAYLKDRLLRSPLLSFLIVVDDIDHVEQLNALMVMDILKNSGNSLVIVTTRDVGVLITAGITAGYNLKGMHRNYARELFCWHAFRQAHPCIGYEVLVDNFVDVCGGLPLSLQVLGRHVCGRPYSYWSSELIKVSKTLPRDVKQRLLLSFDALDDEEKQVFMDTACFFVGKPKSIAEKVWQRSGWDPQHALEILKDKCLIEEIKNLSLTLNMEGGNVLLMHDHLRDLGRAMALELSPPHRLWRPRDLKSLELGGFKNILTKTNLRCFHSFFSKSMGFRVTFFSGQSDNYLEISDSLIRLPLQRNSKEQPCIPSWIPLRNLHYLKIHLGQLKMSWENRIQGPSQLKELQISQTSSKEFPAFLGISDNLESILLDARELPIQGLSLLGSLSMNLSSLSMNFSTLKGGQASTKRGDRTLCVSLVILNFKFDGELHWNSGKAPMSGLEKLEINGEEFVSKILISGTHYPSLESIKLHNMENLMEVDLTRVKTLNFLDIGNCPKLKRLAATSDLRIVRNSTSVSRIPDLRNVAGLKVKNCTHLAAVDQFNSISGISGYRMLAQLKITECQELEELRLGHLSCLEKITIENCNHLKYLCFSGMKCLEIISIQANVMVKYFKLDDCENLKTTEFSCEELVELSIQGCPELEELPVFKGLNCLERIIIDGCANLKYFQLYHCRNLKSVSCNSITCLYITSCPELEELSCLSKVEKIEICQCEKIQNIRLPMALICVSVEGCRDLQRVAETGDLTKLRKLSIRKCPQLEELSCLSRVNDMEKIEIYQCEKIQNIRLPTTLIYLSVKSCRDLQRVVGTGDVMKLRELTISNCPELVELPCFSRVNAMEKIEIYQCEKIQNIRLPTTLIYLSIKRCKDLQRVAGTSYLMKLRELTLSDCPELEELSCLSSVDIMEKIEIYQCEKMQNITLPTTLHSLSVEGYRDLQRVVGTGDPLELIELTISNCPKLENLPCLSGVNTMKKIEIFQCEKLQNMEKIEIDCIRWLYISNCPWLEELCLSKVKHMEKIEIDSCEKIQNIRLPTALICLSVESCRELQTLAGNGDLLELRELTIRECPELEELPCLSRVIEMEKIEIYQCQKIQNIMLPTTLIRLSVTSCRDLQRVAGIGDLVELKELTLSDCPELEELPCLSSVESMEKIEIYQCEKIQNITLPTAVHSLSVESCRDLQRVAGTGDLLELKKLTVRDCPVLEEFPCLSKVNDMERIEIDQCEKIQNISLPTTLIYLSVKSCRDLQRVAEAGDLTELKELVIGNCPELELPRLSRLTCLEKMKIYECEKIQNIILPRTLISLSVKDCRDLQRVAATGDLLEFKKLTIRNCPELEELPSLSWLRCLEKIVLQSCEKLQSLAGMEELQALKLMVLNDCNNALRRISIKKLKIVPSKGILLVGRAVDGAESSLNENLFLDANIGVDGVGEIGMHKIYPNWAELSAVFVCFVAAVDINNHPFGVRTEEYMFTAVMDEHSVNNILDEFDDLNGCRRDRIMKGIWARLKKDEMWRSVQLLSKIVDRFYHS